MEQTDSKTAEQQNEAAHKRDGRSTLSEVGYGELKELHFVLQECLERLDECLWRADRLDLDSFQMQYRKAGDRAKRDLLNFVQGVEGAIEVMTGEDASILWQPPVPDPQEEEETVSLAPRAIAIWPSAMWLSLVVAMFLLTSAGSIWLGATITAWRVPTPTPNPVSQIGTEMAGVFTNGFTRRLTSEGNHFQGIVPDDTGGPAAAE